MPATALHARLDALLRTESQMSARLHQMDAGEDAAAQAKAAALADRAELHAEIVTIVHQLDALLRTACVAPPAAWVPQFPSPTSEVVVLHVPLVGYDAKLFLAGVRASQIDLTVVDLTSRWTHAEWTEQRARALVDRSPAAAAAIEDWFALAGGHLHPDPAES